MKYMKRLTLLVFLCVIFVLPVLSQADAVSSLNSSEKASEKIDDEEKRQKYEAQLNFSVEHLTKKLGTWRTASLYFQRKSEKNQIIWGEYRLSKRNSIRDEEIAAGIYQPLKNKWAFMVEGSYSPTHKYLGKYSASGEVEKGLKKGYVLHFGGKFKKYDAVKANTGYIIAEKYWGNNRGAYTLYVTKLSNAGTAPIHRFQYNRYYGESVNSFGAAFSIGREHENLGPGLGILRSNTWSVSLSAKHWLTKNVGLNVDGTIHRQGDFYYRRGFTFGLRYRF